MYVLKFLICKTVLKENALVLRKYTVKYSGIEKLKKNICSHNPEVYDMLKSVLLIEQKTRCGAGGEIQRHCFDKYLPLKRKKKKYLA